MDSSGRGVRVGPWHCIGWLALWWGGPAQAQELVLSLEEALLLARDRSEQIDAAEAGVDRARGQILQARSGFFPDVLGSVAYTRTFASEFDDIGAAFEGAEPPVGEGPDGAPVEEDGAPIGDLPFGRENAWNIGLTVSQILYAGGRVRAQTDIAEAGRHVAELEVLQARAQVLYLTAQAYFDVQLAAEFADIAGSGVSLARTTLAQTRVGFDVGAQPEFDVLRAQVEVDNQVMNLIVAERQLELAELQLHQLLDVPTTTPIVLSTPLEVGADPSEQAFVLANIPPDVDARERAVVQQAERAVDIAEAGVRVARSQWFPTVTASFNAGIVSYPQGILPPLDPDDWRENITAGVALQVPLFTGFRIRGEVMAARADVREREALLELTEELAELDTATVLADLAAAEATLEATSGTVAVAQRAYAIAQVRYQQGVSSQFELSDALLQLQQARANRARAVRDLLLLRVRLALLPALPVQATSAVIGATRTMLDPSLQQGVPTGTFGTSFGLQPVLEGGVQPGVSFPTQGGAVPGRPGSVVPGR